MKQKMLLVARYNFAYNLPALIDYDEELLNSAGLSYGHHNIIDHWAEKSRIIKVYSNPKKEYYKEAIKRNRVSNYEYMLEYLGSLPNKKNETEEWTFKELNERFKEQCKHTQDNINSSQSENDEKYPWITQLREEHYLWDEQTAKKAITIIEENNIAYKAALSKKRREEMIARGKKGLAKTMWVKNVPFNMVSVSGGRIRYVDNTNIMSWKELYGSYLIGETEVTEELWCAVMNGNKNSSQLPAMASFEEWSQFIIQLNKLTGKKYKIPSWGEWFNAAQDRNEFSGSANIGEVAWYGGNANDIQDVAQKKANKHGLFDMSGNAWEFLENGYCAGGSFAHGYTTVKRTDICRIDEGHTYSLKNVKAGLRLVLKIER